MTLPDLPASVRRPDCRPSNSLWASWGAVFTLRWLIRLMSALALCGCLPSHAKEFVVAQIVPLSGPVAEPGRMFAAGAALYFDQVNASGGLGGRRIRHVTLDDRYDVPTSIDHLNRLLAGAEAPSALLTFGTASTLAVAAELDRRGTRLAVFPTGTGSSSLRKPFNRNLFHVRASYATEYERLIKGFSETGVRSFAIVYQDDAFGRDALQAVQTTLAALNRPPAREFRHERGQQDISALADAAAKGTPELVLLANNPAVAATFIRRAHEIRLPGRIATISDIDANELIQRIGLEASRYVVLSQSLPDPANETRALSVNFGRLARARQLPRNAYALEGYLQARIIAEGLKRMAGNSALSMIDALESITDLDLGGYIISFSGKSHEGASFVDTGVISATGRLVR